MYREGRLCDERAVVKPSKARETRQPDLESFELTQLQMLTELKGLRSEKDHVHAHAHRHRHTVAREVDAT